MPAGFPAAVVAVEVPWQQSPPMRYAPKVPTRSPFAVTNRSYP